MAKKNMNVKNKSSFLFALKIIASIPFLIIGGILGGIVGLLQGVRDWFRPMKILRPIPQNHVSLEVPERFKDLLRIAERLDIGDDVERLKMESTLSESEKNGMRAAIKGRAEDLEQWIDNTMVHGQIAEVAIPLSNMLQALSEMGLLEGQLKN